MEFMKFLLSSQGLKYIKTSTRYGLCSQGVFHLAGMTKHIHNIFIRNVTKQ